jgi:hypothetical protein
VVRALRKNLRRKQRIGSALSLLTVINLVRQIETGSLLSLINISFGSRVRPVRHLLMMLYAIWIGSKERLSGFGMCSWNNPGLV